MNSYFVKEIHELLGVHIVLEPGDATRYEFGIHHRNDKFIVSVNNFDCIDFIVPAADLHKIGEIPEKREDYRNWAVEQFEKVDFANTNPFTYVAAILAIKYLYNKEL